LGKSNYDSVSEIRWLVKTGTDIVCETRPWILLLNVRLGLI